MLAHNSQDVWAPSWLSARGLQLTREGLRWRLRLFRHDHITKRAERLAWLFAEHLPRWLRYWVVITAAADASRAEPNREVPTITWSDMAKALER